MAVEAEAQVVEPAEPDSEAVDVWRQAYQLELDRAELIDAQLRSELDKLGGAKDELRVEFEGCLLDMDEIPQKPESQAEQEWAQAYLAIRRCNEQSELKVAELRAKLQVRSETQLAAQASSVTLDLGPIRFQGIRFKGLNFPRLSRTTGSSMFFVELKMPLGLRLEEINLPQPKSAPATVIEVQELVEGGSAAEDGRVRVGDLLRAITVPQRRLSKNEEIPGEAGGGFDGVSVAMGVGAGQLTKAVLIIPTDGSFPFDRVLTDIMKNSQLDSYVGLVFERPYS